jgi:meso-butanediol dehydrogenase / (S,S)-butanediol dehydrogenase / diacetyl reductase
MHLSDKVIAITGGGRGIGRSCALAYGREGASVAVTDLDDEAAQEVAEELKADGCRAGAWRLDVTDAPAIERTILDIDDELGPLDIWHNNAGVSSMKRLLDLSEAEWDHNMDVNAKGTFLCSRAFAGYLVARGRAGTIVNTASMAGKKGAAPFLAHYVASKFAVVGLTQAMALELAPLGIRVNSICPGYVATAMQDREVEWEAELRGISVDQVRRLYVSDTPLGRLETPEDVASVAVFLASDDAAFLTGESINVNGGAFME